MEFSEYVAARRSRLVRSAVLMGCPEADAEDLVQTALAKALRSWDRVTRAQSVDAYVHRILVNTLHDARSRRWRGEIPSLVVPDTAAPTPDLAEGLAVRAALLELVPEQREVLVLRFWADLSERDTAAATGVAVGTVKSRTSRALRTLAERLAADSSPALEAGDHHAH